MALLRYGQGMAGNRLAGLQQSLGIPLAASTQWKAVSGAAEKLRPVYEQLLVEAAQGDVVHNDDTTMRVLELMNEKTRRQALRDDDEPERRGIFTSNILSVGNGHSIALFFTGTRHAGENLREVLARRAQERTPPIQMCDALSRNMPEDLEGHRGQLPLSWPATFRRGCPRLPRAGHLCPGSPEARLSSRCRSQGATTLGPRAADVCTRSAAARSWRSYTNG